MTNILQCCSRLDSRIHVSAIAITARTECGSSADLLGEEVRPHNATTPGTALAACPGTYPVPVMRTCWPTDVWLAQHHCHHHSTLLTLYVCPPTLLLVVVCVLLTVGRCNCHQLDVPHFVTERFLSAVRAWNSLPPEIRNSDSLLMFRRITKTHSFHLSFH